MPDIFLCSVSRAEGVERASGATAGSCYFIIYYMSIKSYDAANNNNQETSPKWNLAASTSFEMAL